MCATRRGSFFYLICRCLRGRWLKRRKHQRRERRLREQPVAGPPALLAIVKQKWIDQAFQEFAGGKDVICFGTNSPAVTRAISIKPSRVYFKPIGSVGIYAVADCVGVTTENIIACRLRGSEHSERSFYYGFRNLIRLKDRLPIGALRHFGNRLTVSKFVQGACLVVDPER
jgi:hypothetical protein